MPLLDALLPPLKSICAFTGWGVGEGGSPWPCLGEAAEKGIRRKRSSWINTICSCACHHRESEQIHICIFCSDTEVFDLGWSYIIYQEEKFSSSKKMLNLLLLGGKNVETSPHLTSYLRPPTFWPLSRLRISYFSLFFTVFFTNSKSTFCIKSDLCHQNITTSFQTFTAWVNSHLRKAGTQIENIEEDFR